MLAADRASYSIAGNDLVRDVSLAVHPGEVLALLGPNGAGKTTFLKLLSGELAPSAGVVMLEGKPLAQWTKPECARVRAVMPQGGHVAFPFTAAEIVLLGRSPHVRGAEDQQDWEIALAAMALTDTDKLAPRYYDTLSGGEKQRVQLARVLSQIWDEEPGQTRYLLLDEPVAGLDPAHQHAALKIARDFSRRQAGVLIILHDINLAAMYADQVAVFHEGELRQCGAPDQVLTGALIKEVFELDAILQRHPTRDCAMVIAAPL